MVFIVRVAFLPVTLQNSTVIPTWRCVRNVAESICVIMVSGAQGASKSTALDACARILAVTVTSKTALLTLVRILTLLSLTLAKLTARMQIFAWSWALHSEFHLPMACLRHVPRTEVVLSSATCRRHLLMGSLLWSSMPSVMI